MAKDKRGGRVLTADDRRWVEKLEDWVEQVEHILEMVQGGRSLVGSSAADARREFAAFKRDLRAEVKRLATLERRGELQGFARTDYDPAIRQTLADLTIATNSVPGPAWFNAFYNAQITLSHPLSGVKKKK